MTAAETFEERFRRLMPKSDDLILVVLKGHLLLEEQINALLSHLLPNHDALAPARLEFFDRLCVARALVPVNALGGMFDQAEKLNALRNKLAHKLDPPQIED